MEYRFASESLAKMASDPKFDAKLPPGVANAFRKVLTWIKAAHTEQDLRAMKSLRFEKMREKAREGQFSMRLNDQYRLIITIEQQGRRGHVIVLRSIEDYH